MSKSGWEGPYTMDRVEALHELTMSIDPRTARESKEWWESRTINQLWAERSGAWNCNEPGSFMTASCYLTALGELPVNI